MQEKINQKIINSEKMVASLEEAIDAPLLKKETNNIKKLFYKK